MNEKLHHLHPFTERLGFILKRGQKAYTGQGTMLVCDPVELSFTCRWWRPVKLTRDRPVLIKGKEIRKTVFTFRLRDWEILSHDGQMVEIADVNRRNSIILTPIT
ncbi:MAG: hypothetical protein KBD47_01285 [Candidatus Pacebacteria bacterium]|jgi:hypothetical protein|nr:hypothetical protein [Candidatus Paceibacterota bacterium]